MNHPQTEKRRLRLGNPWWWLVAFLFGGVSWKMWEINAYNNAVREAKAAADYGATLAPDMDFAKVAEAAGAHGELVADPAALEGAVTSCMAALKAGRSAVLHAKVTRL